MTDPRAIPKSVPVAALLLALALLPAGCRSTSAKPKEYAYVAAPQVALRDRVSALYNKTGMVKNGERLEVLERSKRFVRVRSERNEEGWMEQRYLVGPEIYDGFQKLAADNARAPTQAQGVTRSEVNMHITPGRDSESLYRLKEGERTELLQRAASEKPGAPQAAPSRRTPSKKEEAPAKVMEDWWLVRDGQRRAGWVLARLLDIDVPLDVAQYAEGQRIVACLVLNQVDDGGKKVPQYLLALTEPRNGLPFDYSQVRVFTWNLKRHRYETAYRERRLFGVLPIRTGTQDFGREGVLPVFVLRLRGKDGNIGDLTYKMNGVMVRRVLPPGEQKPAASRPTSGRRLHHR